MQNEIDEKAINIDNIKDIVFFIFLTCFDKLTHFQYNTVFCFRQHKIYIYGFPLKNTETIYFVSFKC